MKLKVLLLTGLLCVPLFFTAQTAQAETVDNAFEGGEHVDSTIALTKDTGLYHLNHDGNTRSLAVFTSWYSDTSYGTPDLETSFQLMNGLSIVLMPDFK